MEETRKNEMEEDGKKEKGKERKSNKGVNDLCNSDLLTLIDLIAALNSLSTSSFNSSTSSS